MATLDDIRTVLADLIGTVVYPNGGNEPPIVSLPGVIIISPGWPKPEDISLNKLAYPTDGLGNAVIAVQDLGAVRDVTRFPRTSISVSKGVPTLFWNEVGNILTLSGAVVTPQNLAIVLNHNQDFVYSVQPTDTLQSIIASMAALIPASFDIDVNENSIYFPNASSVIGRAGAFSRNVILTGQYRATICVALWCGDDTLRKQLIGSVKPMLDLLTRFTMPDGTIATVIGTGREATVLDMEGMGIESSRLLFEIEFSSAETSIVPQAIVIRTPISTGANGVILTQEA